jgi:hydrogenase maturation protease
VIGYGNVLRGDDGAGPAAAEALREELSEHSAEVLIVHQLVPELCDRISRSKLAIFIDADWQSPPGKVHRRNLTLKQETRVIGHHQSPENLLKMASELYGHAPPAVLFNVGAADFRFQEGLSAQVKQAIPDLVREIVQTVEQAAVNAEQREP